MDNRAVLFVSTTLLEVMGGVVAITGMIAACRNAVDPNAPIGSRKYH
ncbi:MAG: hypothetical protein R3C03_20530 [Pirellulaceae bacterium]